MIQIMSRSNPRFSVERTKSALGSEKSELWKMRRILWKPREYGESGRTIRAQSRDLIGGLCTTPMKSKIVRHTTLSAFFMWSFPKTSASSGQLPKTSETSTPFVSNLIIVVLTIVTYNYFLIRPAINHLRFECCWDVEMFRLFQYNKCTFKFYNWKKSLSEASMK